MQNNNETAGWVRGNRVSFKGGIAVVLAVCVSVSASGQGLWETLTSAAESMRERSESEPADPDIRSLFAKAKDAEKDGNINFFGFYTGMPKADADALVAHYELRDVEAELSPLVKMGLGWLEEFDLLDTSFAENPETHEVYAMRFSLKDVQRITKGGNTYSQVAEAVRKQVGDMEPAFSATGGTTWKYKTIDGVSMILTDEARDIACVIIDAPRVVKAENAKQRVKRLGKRSLNKDAGPGATQREQKKSQAIPELKAMIVALEAAQKEWTPANFKKLEDEWKALPEKWKQKMRENVFWATCAMYLAKGHPEKVSARRAVVDESTLLNQLTDRCHECGGAGRRMCRICGGSGVKRVRCSTCGGSGSCSFCHGSGQTGGALSGRPLRCPQCGGRGVCRSCAGNGEIERACADCSGGTIRNSCQACGGTGRIASQKKCMEAVEDNLEKALRICRGESDYETSDFDEW